MTVKLFLNAFIGMLFAASVCSADSSAALREDLARIESQAGLPKQSLQVTFAKSEARNKVLIQCNSANKLLLSVEATAEEQASTFYYGLHKLGFYFPHPKIQITPTAESLKAHCGQTYNWQPTLAYRGFQLQTAYPSEWIAGFFRGDAAISKDTILWMARNFQNIVQFQLLQNAAEVYSVNFVEPLKLAHDLQMRVGISVSLVTRMQKKMALLPLWRAITGYKAYDALIQEYQRLAKLFNFDFMTVELGLLESTFLSYDKTLELLNSLSIHARSLNKFVLVNAPLTSHKFSGKFGSYQQIAKHANPALALLAQTAMFYNLSDAYAPVYDRKNFSDITPLMSEESKKRITWYQPETNHFLGYDIDVPLLLTDYMRGRVSDYKKIVDLGIKGHLCRTTGQELGQWLIDWTVALQSSSEYLGQELASLKLLNENLEIWQKIFDFQTKYIKETGSLSSLAAESPLDRIPFAGHAHERIALSELTKNESHLRYQIELLENAHLNQPDISGVKNEELKLLLEVTFLRMDHAKHLRLALLNQFDKAQKNKALADAQSARRAAFEIMVKLTANFSRYPNAHVFEKYENPTSYKYGYGWTAKTLHFWENEEAQIQSDSTNLFFTSPYDPIEILF